MKKNRLLAGCLALAVFGAGCGQTGTGEKGRSSEQSAPVREESLDQEEASDQTEEAVTETEGETVTRGALPEELAEIPQDYFSQSDQQGTLVELEYDTYESMAYEDKEQILHKRAIVYLPYGYSEDTRYNPVFRRSTRKFPALLFFSFFVSSSVPRFFLYLQQIFNALSGLFLLEKFF